MLKVGLDLRATEQGFKSHFGRGTGRYATELSKLLPKIAAEREDIQIIPVSSDKLSGSALEKKLVSFLPFGRQTIEGQISLPRRLNQSGVDLFHFFAHGDAPAYGGFSTVVTVLDLIPLKFRDLYRAPNENLRYQFARHLELAAIKNARGIIAISEATKSDLKELLGVEESKIAVTPLAADSRFSLKGDVECSKAQLREKFGLPLEAPLLLYLGGIDPRKNVNFLLEVFSELLNVSPSSRLVFAGRHEGDKFYPQFKKKIEDLNLESKLVNLGFVGDETLPDLYRAVDIFTFPSLYEGFGLPVLEAALTGVPIVAEKNSSLPELLGDEYPLLRGYSVSDWRDRIHSLIQNSEERGRLTQLGLNRSEHFSWMKTANSTIEAYLRFGSPRLSL